MGDSIIVGTFGARSKKKICFFSNGYIFYYFHNLLLIVMSYKMLQSITI